MPEEKEIAIYQAVLDILTECGDMTQIKVSDIAAKAGIGKGTAYGFFSCKEDMIAGALQYLGDSTLARLQANVSAANTFEGKLSAVAALVREAATYHLLIVQNLYGGSGLHCLEGHSRGEFLKLIAPVFEEILQKGAEEALYPHPKSVFIGHMACVAWLTQLVLYSVNSDSYPQWKEDDAVKKITEMLVITLKNS